MAWLSDTAFLLDLLLWLAAGAFIVVGIAGLVVPVLPGPPLLLIGLILAAWAEGFAHVGWLSLLLIGLLALLAVIGDLLAGAFGARRYGASRLAVAGALLGGVVGIVFGPVGFLLGPFVGAVLGELLQGRRPGQAGRAGWGATLGLLLGTVLKLVLGLMMISLYLLVRFWG